MSVNTQVPVKAGNELFAFYGYGEESRDDHEWYFEQFDQLEKMKEKERKKKKKQKESAWTLSLQINKLERFTLASVFSVNQHLCKTKAYSSGVSTSLAYKFWTSLEMFA